MFSGVQNVRVVGLELQCIGAKRSRRYCEIL